MRSLLAAFAVSAIATPALAQLRPIADQPASAEAARAGVDVLFVNDGAAPADPQAPEMLEVTAADGARLQLVRDAAPGQPVAPGGFVRLRYRPAPMEVAQAPQDASTPETPPRETLVPGSNGTAAAILDRFEPYRPIYGVFGAGDSAAKLQLSLAFRPFDSGALGGLKLAWTQTMFWAIDQDSGPFRSTNYAPEVFYEVPLAEKTVAAIGYAHDSNGRGAIGSIDVNRIYARLARRFDLGDRWYAEVTPQAWFYVGKQGVAPDIERFWGYGALGGSIGRVDGLKLSVTARGNPGTGKGAAELYASYPLARLGGGLGIYAFGQGFTGFGEAIDDYDVRDTHARFGIALTR